MFTDLQRGALFLTLAGAVACVDEPSGPARSERTSRVNKLPVAAAELAAAIRGRALRGAEDDILRIEAVLPGFGGMFIDNGVINLFVPKGNDAVNARAAIAQVASSLRLVPELREQLARGDNLNLLQADFAFSQLIEWQTALASRVKPDIPIFGIDADEKKNRLRVLILPGGTRAEVLHLAALANIPDAAIEVEVGTPPSLAAGLRGTWRPTGGGIQWANSDAGVCTIGFNVTAANGSTGFLTASHCTAGAVGYGYIGGAAHQPIPANDVGYVAVNPAWNSTDPNCMGRPLCTEADAMYVQYWDGNNAAKRMPYTQFTGVNNGGGSITVTGWWNNVTASTSPVIGQSLDKLGRLTGWTRGTLAATCVHIVEAAQTHLCSDQVNGSRAGNGDSGGPIFIPPPSGQVTQALYPVGILWGRDPATANVYDPENNAWYCDGGAGQCVLYYSNWARVQNALQSAYYPY